MKIRFLLASPLLVSVFLVACGGDQKRPASPENNAAITETSTKEDMPPPPAKEGDAPAPAPAEAKAAGPGPAGGVIKIAAMKLTPAKKGKTDKAIELKDDGTVLIDGKPAAKIKGDQVDSTGGTSMLTVGVDGSLVGNGVKPGLKFEGDEVVTDNGMKLSVGDDGTINATRDGKTEAVGKAEGGASSKRAALVVAVLYMTLPTMNGDAKPAGADKKPAAATADKKPAAPAKK